MADNNTKAVAFNPDSYAPVHDSFTSTDIHSSAQDMSKAMPTADQVDTRIASQSKAEEKDTWYEAAAFGLVNTTLSAARSLTTAWKGINDPFDAMNIPTSIDWVGALSLIDEVIALSPGINGQRPPSIVKDLGFKAPEPLINKFFQKMAASSGDVEKLQGIHDQMEQGYQESKKETQLAVPILEQAGAWWESKQDNKANWYGSRWADRYDTAVKDAQDYMGAVDTGWGADPKTGFSKWDYLINGTTGLVGSIAGSMVMGMGMGKLATSALASPVLNTSRALNKAATAISNIAISAVQTNGETVQVATDMYKRSISEQIEDIGGEAFSSGQSKAMQEAINEHLQSNPDIGKRDLQWAAFQAGENYKQQWAEQNPEAYKQIEINALKGYHMATAINTLNMVLEPIQTSMYMRGSLRSRGILSKPTRGDWKKAGQSGVSEYMQENMNDIADNAGLAEANGQNYDLHSAVDYAFSWKGFETGAWGFVGGAGEGVMTGMATFAARQKEFQEQLAIIQQQNNIGDSDASTIDQFANLNNSYRGSVQSAKRIAELEQMGDFEGAKMEAERMLRYQAQKAFVTGTTENLIENYKKIASSDKFTPEAHNQARTAVKIIAEMEKAYNSSREFLNADEVYYNLTDQATVKRAIEEEKQKMPDVELKGLSSLTSFLKNKGYKQAEQTVASVMEQMREETNPFKYDLNPVFYNLYEDLHPTSDKDGRVNIAPEMVDMYKAANMLSNITKAEEALIELQVKEKKLTSKSTQNSEFQTTQFYKKIAAWEQDQKRVNPDYSRYESQEYEDYFQSLYRSNIWGKINSESQTEIRNNHLDSKTLAEEIRQVKETATAQQIAREAEALLNPPPVPAAPVAEQAGVTTNTTLLNQQMAEFAALVNTGNAGSPIETTISAAEQTFTDGSEDLFNLSFDPKMLPDDISDEMKNQLAVGVQKMYGILKGDKAEFSFRDLLGAYIAQSGMANAEKASNALVKGWIYAALPGHNTLDFLAIKREFFSGIETVIDSFNSLVDQIPAQMDEEQTKTDMEQGTESQNNQQNLLNTGSSNNNTPSDQSSVFVDGNIHNGTDATIAHTSTNNQEVNKEEDGVIKSTHKLLDKNIYIEPFAPGNTKLMHPSMYMPGTLLSAKRHPDFMNVPVNTYDIHGKTTGRLTFAEWLSGINQQRLLDKKPPLDENSAEFIAKVPMAIMDTDGEIIGFVPDMERISDFHNTEDTKEPYRKSVLAIRNTVHTGKIANLKVKHKTLGYTRDIALPYDQAIPLKDCDPNSIIAVGRAGKLQFVAGQKEIPENQIVFDKRVVKKEKIVNGEKVEFLTEPHPRHGYSYDLRKCGVITTYNSDGTIASQKDQYYPFYTKLPQEISSEAQNTIYWGINAYLNKNKENHPDYSKILKIIYGIRVKSDTQINLDEKNNIIQLNKLIKMFVFTNDMRGNDIQDVVNKIQLTAKESGTPFIFTQSGKIVIGTAFPRKIGANGKDISATFHHIGDPVLADNVDFMQKLKAHLPLLRQNIGDQGMNHKGGIPVISENGEVTEGYKSYDSYIRSTLTTTGDTREITINRNGKQETFKTSFVQPRIDIVLTDDKIPEAETVHTLQTGVVSEAVIESVAQKIMRGEKVTEAERIAQVANHKAVQDRVNQLQKELEERKAQTETTPETASEPEVKPEVEVMIPFMGKMYTKEQLIAEMDAMNQQARNAGIKPKGNISFDPKQLSDEQKQKVVESSQIIKGVTATQQKQIVDYIFNQIARIVNSVDQKTVGLEQVKQAVAHVFANTLAKRAEIVEEVLLSARNVNELFPGITKVEENIALKEAELELHRTVADNWKVFEDQALVMVKKYMNIKEAVETNLEDESTEEGAEFTAVEGEGEHNFSKRAEQISVKESVSADIKRLCQSIEEVNSSGDPIYGIFGLETYVGFDTIFNTVSSWLAESDANFASMEATMKQYAVSHKWVPQLLEKLNPTQDQSTPKPVNQQLQNEFVTAMCKHALDMEFVMMVKDKSGNYSLKIYSTNSGAITRSLIASWKSNILTTRLITDNKQGSYMYNVDAIEEIMKEYEDLKNESIIPSLSPADERPLKTAVVKFLKDKNMSVGAFADLLKGKSDRHTVPAVNVQDKNQLIQAMRGGKIKVLFGDKELMAYYEKSSDSFVFKKLEYLKPTQSLITWLANFGIEISEATANEILDPKKGFKYDSKVTVKWEDQWKGDQAGKGVNLLGTLHGTIKDIHDKIKGRETDGGGLVEIIYDESDIDGDKILGQSIINSLAAMEAKHTTHRVVQSFYDNHKSIYGFTASKFITDRIKNLKLAPEQNQVLAELLKVSFSKNSMWLNMLSNDASFRDNFKVIHLGLTALKELGKTLYRDNDLQALSDIDHELVKLGFFQQDQGNVSTSWSTDPMYTGLSFRMARMFSPTMSDKGTMTLIKTAVLNITSSVLKNKLNYDKMLAFTYSQTVTPEMERISNFKNKVEKNGPTNIKGYDKGAGMFFLMPALNNMKFNHTSSTGEVKQVSLLILLSNMDVKKAESLTVEMGGVTKTVKEHITDELDGHIKNEQKNKIEQWKKAKFVTMDSTGETVTGVKFLDKNYMFTRGAGSAQEKVNVAALDFTVNSMIANANSFMCVAGDPATCYKKDPDVAPTDYATIAKQTLINVGKRLADQIAPRNKLADSDTNSYMQLFLADTYTVSDRIHYIVRSLDSKEITPEQVNQITNELKTKGDGFVKNKYKDIYPKSVDYLAIESTNAQEYTTWREHLYVLEKLGKLPNVAIAVSQAEIEQAKEIFSGKKKMEDLTDGQKELVKKILQPMKPVYTGQVYSKKYDMMRKMYIKTSSFPLIPQLTSGLEIDKLAKAMERIESSTGKTVRASYESGNKVGGIANPLKTSDNSGKFLDYSSMSDKDFMDHMGKFTLELPRSNFGIQQNVPFKSEIKEYDAVSMGTQITKLLFGNIVMKLKGFSLGRIEKTGIEMHREYADTFNAMVTDLRKNLYDELGINVRDGKVTDHKKTLKRLEAILKTEASLRGYPKQDIEALGIDPETGTFNLPIWLSPNAQRYEALLAAIITHRMVKVKFPGYSYVAGSQSGFKMQDSMEGIEQSQVVFTDKWTGELKANQVLMPCKLRLPGAERPIDLLEMENGQYKWVKKVTKGNKEVFQIDTDKIDPALLSNIPSFRIPSSKHSSMENLEIAGFLPYSSADLMVVSADGTVVMGEDYDVDKRYTYHQWTTVENGKIIPLQMADKYAEEGKTAVQVVEELIEDNEQQISDLKKAYFSYEKKSKEIEELLDEIEVSPQYGLDVTEQQKRVEKLLKKLPDVDPKQLSDDIKLLKDAIKQLKTDKTRLYQNQIVTIHSSVLSHPDVQKLTVEKLSIEDAAKDAEFLESMNEKDERYFTPLSDSYQRSKVAIGAVGKNGTAAYSLDVVSHSLFEQALQSGSPIQLMEYIEVEDDSENGSHKEQVNLSISFGGIKSTGQLGHEKTLSEGTDAHNGERAISDVHSERQNLMVDNEKEQIAIRVHLNDYTMRVDKILNMLGFDKGEDGRSISFLFISQPIIKRYVRMMEDQNSNTTEYDPNKKNRIIDSLLLEMGFQTRSEVESMDEQMTNGYMISQIQDSGSDKAFQAAALLKFLKLESYGTNLTAVQTALNVDSKGIGKNLLEAMEKLEGIKNLGKSEYIKGTQALIGQYAYAKNPVEVENLRDQGYIVVGQEISGKGRQRKVDSVVLVRPTTVSGTFAVNGLVSATQVWGNYFPYQKESVIQIFDEVMEIMGNSEMSDGKKVELKQMIFNDMKKYLYTDQAIGSLQENMQKERFRLFFDQYGTAKKGEKQRPVIKQSLASFLHDLKNNPSQDVKNLLRSNRLLSRFQYEISTLGNPSLIKFNNAAAENFDEQFMYNSIIELVEADIDLGVFDGKPYRSSDLAQDLTAYAYLEGGIQEASQFVKYLPVSYLKEWGINNIVRGTGFTGRNTLGIRENVLSVFTKQFIQHHAGQVRKITPEMMLDKNKFKPTLHLKTDDLSTLQRFTFDSDQVKQEPFVSIYNEKLPKGQSKYQLYQLDKDSGEYRRIPTLGIFGMSEYMAEQENYPSLVNQPTSIQAPVSPPTNGQGTKQPAVNKFQTLSKDPKKVVEAVSKMNSPMGKLAQRLLPLVNRLTKMEVEPMNDADGKFNRDTNTIHLDENLLLSVTHDEEIARTILRETVHSIADLELQKYTKRLPIDPATGYAQFIATNDAPAHIKKLVSVFAQAQKALDKEGKLKLLTIQGREVRLTPEQHRVTYGGYDIFEFVERMMTTPELRAELDKAPFKESGLSITQKFVEWLTDVMAEVKKTLSLDMTEGSITENAMASIFELFEAKKAEMSQTKEDAQTEQMIFDVQSMLGSPMARETEGEQTGNIEDILGQPLSQPGENTSNPVDDYTVDESDEFLGLDPKMQKMSNFDSITEHLLSLGSLTIKC